MGRETDFSTFPSCSFFTTDCPTPSLPLPPLQIKQMERNSNLVTPIYISHIPVAETSRICLQLDSEQGSFSDNSTEPNEIKPWHL